MKTFSLCLAAFAAAVTMTAVAAARPEAAKQRVAISIENPDNGTFVLTPLQAGRLKRDSGTVSVTIGADRPPVIRQGQEVWIYKNLFRFKGKRGSFSIRERGEWVNVSNKKAPGTDYTPGVGMGTWTVVGGTGAYANVTGGGRSGQQGHPEWLVLQEGFLTP